MRIFLIRHGESEGNAENRFIGAQGVYKLTEKGKLQAKKSAQIIRKLGVDTRVKMFSSTTVRAKETAEIISNELGYEFEMDSRLREIELGELEGKTLLEVDKKYANVIRDFSEKPSECEIPGGESVPQVQQRVLSFIYDRLDENNDLVIVSHDIAIRTFLVHAMSMSIDFIWSLSPSELMSGFQSPFEYGDKDIPLSSVSVVKYRDGEFIVKSIGMMVA